MVIIKISFDAGHNCTPDTGASGILFEDTINREVVALMSSKFQALGHQVKDCTPYGQTFSNVTNSLAYRVNQANTYGSDVHLCIHANCYNGAAYGTESWIYATGGQSQTYATKINTEICSAIGTYNRGVKVDANLYVPKYTNMPCVLVEMLFVDNSGDAAKYNADKIATAIVKAVTGQTPPSLGFTPNATVVNDFFYLRDANGNLVGGQINIGAQIQVLSINYDKQLAQVRYSTQNGPQVGYITNAANCISYAYQGQWHNGSTSETVYSTSACTTAIGSLDPYEAATPLTRDNGILNVVYNTSKGVNTKSGYVKYNGGFSKF